MTDFPDLKFKAVVQFPARVLDGTGIDIVKSNGSYQFNLDFGDFAPPVSALNDPTNQNALLWNKATNHYDLIPVSILTGSGVFPATAFPLIESGSGAVGASTKYAREDHVHPAFGSTFLQAGTGAVTRTPQDKARDFVHVKDFGAVCDGVTDDTTKIQAALNTGHVVWLPDNANIKITGTLTMLAGGGLVGGGMQSSFLTSSSTTLPMIFAPSTTGHITIANLSLTRSVTATAGADGIAFGGGNQVCVLDGMWIEKQWNGLSLSNTAISYARNLVLHGNQGNGLFMTNTAVLPGFQWVLDNILSEQNGARGFLIATTAGPSTAHSCGQLTRLYSFANNNEGFLASGTALNPIMGLRMSDCFFGEDGGDEVSLDTHGGLHVLHNVFTEIAGTRTTGPALATAASHLGSGFTILPGNTDVELIGCRANGHSENGVVSFADKFGVIGGQYTNNGAFAAKPGLFIRGGSAVRIVGARAGGTPQTYGIIFDAAAITALYEACDFTGNATGTVFNASTGTIKVGGTNLP